MGANKNQTPAPPATQQTQPKVQVPVESPPVSNLIGIYKELDSGESLLHNGVIHTDVIFVKEAEIKKVIGKERKEVPVSISSCFVYMTSKRIIFLKLFELSASELSENVNLLSGVSGTFYEIPLSAIKNVDMRPIKINKNDVDRFERFFGANKNILDRPNLEIVYEEKEATGRAKDYMESMLQRGALSKLWGKVQMVYDKIFILGEQSVILEPIIAERITKRPSSWFLVPNEHS